jgi:hypothetical protein
MEAFNLGDQTFNFDRSATEAAYALLESGFAERCGCADCRNFAAQRSTAFPSRFLTLLDRLGIDRLKEGEAFEYGPEPSGKRLYGGWFYFVGTMEAAGEYQIAENDFSYFIGTSFPKPTPPFRDQTVLAVEFMTRLPWALEAPAE